MKNYLLFCILLAMSISAKANHTVFSCFSYADSYEYSPSPQGRNRGFDLCLQKYTIPNPEYNCPSLADRYYGLSAKNSAVNKCINQTTTVKGCLEAADAFQAITARTRKAISCLKRFEDIVLAETCYSVGNKYSHVKKTVVKYCDQLFEDVVETNSSNYIGDGTTEIIQFRN